MDESAVRQMVEVLEPHLNERQRRLVLAAVAEALGRGGTSLISSATGVSRVTIAKARRELKQPPLEGSRVRRVGAGRKSLREKDPRLMAALEALVDPATRGDPQSPLKWTSKSTRDLANVLAAQGHTVSHTVVAELLREAGYSLQAAAKRLEGNQHPDRDEQFRYLSEQVKYFLAAEMPIVSVDTKKKELVGRYKNGGREWQPKGQPEEVKVHDFIDAKEGKAIPYGIYDVGRNEGWVNVGRDHDTASFAVESLRRWWRSMGSEVYPHANRLLICADSGGSNGYRRRLWKFELQKLADETQLAISVSHLPPGTSKWNKIEHRLFSHISMNWRGRPLVSHEVVVELISATKTRTGLKVHAQLDKGEYPTGVQVTKEQMASLDVLHHEFHGEWNYTIMPRSPS